MKEIDKKADKLLQKAINSKWTALWIASLFLAGWFGGQYYEKAIAGQETVLCIPEGGVNG